MTFFISTTLITFSTTKGFDVGLNYTKTPKYNINSLQLSKTDKMQVYLYVHYVFLPI